MEVYTLCLSYQAALNEVAEQRLSKSSRKWWPGVRNINAAFEIAYVPISLEEAVRSAAEVKQFFNADMTYIRNLINKSQTEFWKGIQMASSPVVGNISMEFFCDVTQQHIDDFMSAAFDCGGDSCLWVIRKVVTPPEGVELEYWTNAISRGGSVELFFEDGDEEKSVVLTLDKFVNGLKAECNRRGLTVEQLYEDHDTSDADNIIQQGVFGSAVFG